MKYCSNCGSQVEDSAKFCTECGQKLEPAVPVQQPEAAPQDSVRPTDYGVSAQQSSVPETGYVPPVQSYQPPTQRSYQPHGQQNYAPQEETYTRPVENPVPYSGEPGFTFGANQSGKPKPGGKKGLVIGLAAAAVVVIIALAVMLFGGSKDPNLGKYEAVSCMVRGMAMDYKGDYIELKSGGKANVVLMGEKYYCAWELEGKTLTITQQGDEFVGTLKNGVIVMDFDGMVYTYENKDYSGPITDDVEDAADAPTETAPTEPAVPAEIGYWQLLRVDSDNPDLSMDEETVQFGREMGMEMYLEMREDGTASLVLFEEAIEVKWANGVLYDEGDDDQIPYTIENGQLSFMVEGALLVFVPGEPALEAPAEEPAASAANPYEWWEGDWYGWWVVWEGHGDWEELTNDFWDTYARITVNDDGTGYVCLWDTDASADDPIAEVEVSFVSGTTSAGTLVAEEGYFYNDDMEYGDWYVDPGTCEMSEYDHMIAIYGTYVDPRDTSDVVEYYIILRPWGMDWEDVRTGDNSENIYSDMMPAYYDDWYLPLLEMGITRAPDSYEEGQKLLGK